MSDYIREFFSRNTWSDNCEPVFDPVTRPARIIRSPISHISLRVNLLHSYFDFLYHVFCLPTHLETAGCTPISPRAWEKDGLPNEVCVDQPFFLGITGSSSFIGLINVAR